MQVKIASDEGSKLQALGRVVYAGEGRGPGIAFTKLNLRMSGSWTVGSPNLRTLKPPDERKTVRLNAESCREIVRAQF